MPLQSVRSADLRAWLRTMFAVIRVEVFSDAHVRNVAISSVTTLALRIT